MIPATCVGLGTGTAAATRPSDVSSPIQRTSVIPPESSAPSPSSPVPTPARDAAFETLLGNMLGWFAEAPDAGVDAAASRALAELCRSFGLAGACLLVAEPANTELAFAAGACGDSQISLRDLFEGLSDEERRAFYRQLAASSPLLFERDEGAGALARQLREHAADRTIAAKLEISGQPSGVLLLVALPGTDFSARLLTRLRLLSDLFAVALARRAPLAAPRLTAAEMRDVERRNMLAVLEHCRWRLQGAAGAAALLGLSPSTLRDRMRSFGIRRPGA
jgi:transcriptional regulator with GAF, ATPase, and Fis domain